MNWDDLRILLAVERAGTLTAAATLLDVNQTTVTRRLAALQKRLGARLIESTPAGYRLTAAGRQACAAGREAEAAIQALDRTLAGQDDAVSGLVRITLPGGGIATILAAVVAQLQARHPQLRFELTMSTASLNLARREADIALRLHRESQPSLLATRIGSSIWGLFATEAYLRRKGPVKALAGHDFVGFDGGLALTPGGRWLSKHVAGARVLVRTNDLTTAATLGAQGLGAVVLPAWFASREPALRTLPEARVGASELFLVTQRDLIRIPRVRVTLDALKLALRRELPAINRLPDAAAGF